MEPQPTESFIYLYGNTMRRSADYSTSPPLDITLINIGTNDNNTSNNITSAEFYNSYIQLINEIHTHWPDSQIIVLSLWSGFSQVGNTWQQGAGFLHEIREVVRYFNNGSLNDRGGEGFVHYFNTTGICTYINGQKGSSNHVVATWSLTMTDLTFAPYP